MKQLLTSAAIRVSVDQVAIIRNHRLRGNGLKQVPFVLLSHGQVCRYEKHSDTGALVRKFNIETALRITWIASTAASFGAGYHKL